MGEEADDIRFQFSEDANIALDVTADIDLGLGIDWVTGAAEFDLHRLGFQAVADTSDLQLTAGIGPLGLAVGSPGEEYASAHVTLGGTVSLANDGALGFTPGENHLDLDLPLYATLAGTDLGGQESGGNRPRLLLSGDPFADAGVTFEHQYLDELVKFSGFSIAGMAAAFQDLLALAEEFRETPFFQTEVPFVGLELGSVLDFAQVLDDEFVSKIDFYRPLAVLATATEAAWVESSGEADGHLAVGDLQLVEGAIATEEGETLSVHDLEDKYLTIEGGETYQITGVAEDGSHLTLNRSLGDTALADLAFTVHEQRESIETLQEFVIAINNAGIPCAGIR